MKMTKSLLLFGMVAALGMTAGAQEASTEAVTEAASEAQAQSSASELSDKWSDYQIRLNDTVYQFPMMYSDFEALGWTTEDTLEELEPNQYGMYHFVNGDYEVTVYLLNLGVNTQQASECIVAGLDVDSFYWEVGEGTVELPGGIVRGESDGAAIEASYGTPSDTYEGDMYTQYTYETDSYCSVTMEVSKESGVLEDITVRNFVAPEGFDAGEASDEVPEAVLAYEKPAALGEDLSVYEIEVDGQAYTLPVPVSVLIEDGWELDTNKSEQVIPAGSSGWATLRKGGQEIRDLVRNEEAYATVPQNCWIEKIELGEYITNVDGSLPCGIKNGMAEEDFLAVLDGAGAEYELEESGDYKYYTFSMKEYDQCYEVTVYAGEDGSFEKNTIMKIACRNTFE